MIEVPIQDRWLKNEQALAGLSGKSLQIPIYGTFDKPRVDQQAVANLTRDLLRDTARQAIGGEINRQLEKLFKQRKSFRARNLSSYYSFFVLGGTCGWTAFRLVKVGSSREKSGHRIGRIGA